MQIAILGRQPKISLAELECLFSDEKITPISDYAALVDVDRPLPQSRLGGTIKCAKVIYELKNADLDQAFSYLKSSILEQLIYLPEGKLQFGVSVYGFKAQKNWLLKKMLDLKKIIKKNGRSVRIIENKSEALETAQVLYNKLTGPLGLELLIIKNGSDVILAQTTSVQDIDAYRRRDFERPKRDAYVGMLPPKLAQIMINLAHPQAQSTILDPFCGTGVVLQEALLLGYNAYGTDLSEKMIHYSQENLVWLSSNGWIPVQAKDDKTLWHLEVADATSHTWHQPVDSVVCETYLGTPLTTLPDKNQLNKIVDETNKVAKKFLINIAPQLKKGARLCIALPAWHLGNGNFKHLEMLDHLEDMGYNRLDLVHAKKTDLIYHRENQVVARELTILVKN